MVAQDWRVGGNGIVSVNAYRVSFEDDENVLKLIVVAQLYSKNY